MDLSQCKVGKFVSDDMPCMMKSTHRVTEQETLLACGVKAWRLTSLIILHSLFKQYLENFKLARIPVIALRLQCSYLRAEKWRLECLASIIVTSKLWAHNVDAVIGAERNRNACFHVIILQMWTMAVENSTKHLPNLQCWDNLKISRFGKSLNAEMSCWQNVEQNLEMSKK